MLFSMILATATAGSGAVNNPGGERIPFVKLRSEVWDVVIRKTADDRARIERVKAQCQGIWVNACAPGVDPELRQLALQSVFQPGVALSGDFTYCSTAIVRDLPEDLGRKLIRGSTDSFCQIFLDPESVRGMRSGNATQGENDLVNRLMGGQGTTSGKILMKAPPTVEGTSSGAVTEATGDRRRPGIAQPTRPAPVASGTPEPYAPDSRTVPAGPRDSPFPTPPSPVATAPQPVDMGGSDMPEHASKGAFDDFVMPEPAFQRPPAPVATAPVPTAPVAAPVPQEPAFISTPGLEDDSPVFVPPEPAPAPEPIDPELAELLAPVPQIDSQAALGNGMAPRPAPTTAPVPTPRPDPSFTPPPPEPKGPVASNSRDREPSASRLADSSLNATAPPPRMEAAAVVVPAPKPEPVRAPTPAPPPKPTGPSEFELEAMETENLDRLSDRNSDEDDKKKKKKKDKDAPTEQVGGDEEFGDYVIIDIESLPDE
ncbi:MAG: hypothetical protein R3F61_07970 [Myxococcota bacterium]